jgi:hypothetical protein
VEEINKIKLSNGENDVTYFWIDPRVYNDENAKNLKFFKENISSIEEFSSIGSLQK